MSDFAADSEQKPEAKTEEKVTSPEEKVVEKTIPKKAGGDDEDDDDDGGDGPAPVNPLRLFFLYKNFTKSFNTMLHIQNLIEYRKKNQLPFLLPLYNLKPSKFVHTKKKKIFFINSKF